MFTKMLKIFLVTCLLGLTACDGINSNKGEFSDIAGEWMLADNKVTSKDVIAFRIETDGTVFSYSIDVNREGYVGEVNKEQILMWNAQKMREIVEKGQSSYSTYRFLKDGTNHLLLNFIEMSIDGRILAEDAEKAYQWRLTRVTADVIAKAKKAKLRGKN